MQHNCERHTFETAEGVCRSCNGTFCADCLLYPFGPSESPFCKPCAITAGGIRSTAANPRRVLPEGQKANKRSGGLFGRLRRSAVSPEADEDEELSPAEIIEREAEEARRMLDAQRLPAESEEDPEEVLPAFSNIAPPAGSEEETELAHREVPTEIAGGLDLPDDDGPSAPAADDATTPNGARPETAHEAAASRGRDPATDGLDPAPADAVTPSSGTEPDPAPDVPARQPPGFDEAGPPPRVGATPDGPVAAPSVTDPGVLVGQDADTADAPTFDNEVASPIPQPGDDAGLPVAPDRGEQERKRTLALAAEARTADGVPLFAPSAPQLAETDTTKTATAPLDTSGRPASGQAGGRVDEGDDESAETSDTRELLRRISELRGR